MITVTDTGITAVLIAGDWFNVSGVVIDFAEYLAPNLSATAHGLHLAATIQGGPNNGHKFVAPLSRIDAVRV